jgi:hypothetical protein
MRAECSAGVDRARSDYRAAVDRAFIACEEAMRPAREAYYAAVGDARKTLRDTLDRLRREHEIEGRP